jgi:hypothetical protein
LSSVLLVSGQFFKSIFGLVVTGDQRGSGAGLGAGCVWLCVMGAGFLWFLLVF